jgi:hypothetical protein
LAGHWPGYTAVNDGSQLRVERADQWWYEGVTR